MSDATTEAPKVCHCGRPHKAKIRRGFPVCSGCNQPVGSCQCGPLAGVPACSCGRPLYNDEENRSRCLKCNGLMPDACRCPPLNAAQAGKEAQP